MKSKEIKRAEAQERQSLHSSLSKEEKLQKLNRKLGKGVGAKKERSKLSE